MTSQMSPKEVKEELETFINSNDLGHIGHELFYTKRHKDNNIGSDGYKCLTSLYKFDDDYDYWFQVRFYSGVNKKIVIAYRMHFYNNEVLKPVNTTSIDVTINFVIFKLDALVSLLDNNVFDDTIVIPKHLESHITQIKKEYNLVLLSKKI